MIMDCYSRTTKEASSCGSYLLLTYYHLFRLDAVSFLLVVINYGKNEIKAIPKGVVHIDPPLARIYTGLFKLSSYYACGRYSI